MDEEKKETQRQRFAYREQQSKKEFIRIVNLTKKTLAKYNWAKYVAADKVGSIFAFSKGPVKKVYEWFPQKDDLFKSITEEQAIVLCGRVPQWDDTEPTPVKF